MTRHTLTIAVTLTLGALVLAGCDKPKVRHVPSDPMALAPAAATAPPKDGVSAGLNKLTEFPGFYVDRIGEAQDPLNRQPAGTPGDAPIVLSGFGFDPVAKQPGKGIDLVIDDKAYATTYGLPRPDVARFFKTSALADTGYTATLPAGALTVGPHAVSVRVIAVDGKGYYESPQIAFAVD